MTTLAQGTSVTVGGGDGATFAIATNGGLASIAITLSTGEVVGENIGPLPYRRTWGPYKEGATAVITNQTAVLDYDTGASGSGLTTTERDWVRSSVSGGGGGALGPYADLAALIAASPAAANAGKTAMVGAAAPYQVFCSAGVTWELVGNGARQYPMQKWQRALAGARAKSRHGRIVVVGDSTSNGMSASALYSATWSKIMTTALQGMGYPVSDSSFLGGKGITLNTGAAWTYDPRVTASAAGVINTGIVIGAPGYFTISAGGSITFVPSDSCDTIRFYFIANGTAGVMSYQVDGGAANNVTIPSTPPAGYTSQTFTFAAGVHTFTLNYVSGGVTLIGAECWLSTDPKVSILNSAYSGQSMFGLQASGVAGWAITNWLSVLAPDLTILHMGTNDTGRTLVQFQGDTDTTIAGALAAGGDLIVCIFHPNNNWGSGGDVNSAAKRDYLRQKCSALNIPYVDLDRRFVSYTNANALGYMFDAVHCNPIGYADTAQAIMQPLIGANSYSGT